MPELAPKPNVGPDLKSVSPSAIKSFSPKFDGGCRRKHWFDKRCGIKQPSTPAQELGTKLHGQVEDHLLKGIAPKHESVQHLLARPTFPSRGPELLVEHPRNYNTNIRIAGIPIRMRMDLVDPRTPNRVKIWDWKTSGNFQYVQTPETLAEDPQCLVYLYWGTQNFLVDEFDFYHGYISTAPDNKKGEPDSLIVSTGPILRRDVIIRAETVVAPIVEEMKVSFAKDSFEDIEPNWEACDAFRGYPCPYKKFCGVAPAAHLFGASNEDEETPMNDVPATTPAVDPIAARRKVRAVGINPPDASPPTPVTPYVPPTTFGTTLPPTGESIEDALKKLEAAFAAFAAAVRRSA